MKTITRLLATAALLFGVVGGVTSVKAKKTFWNPSGWVATWNATTNTMSWNGSEGNKVMNTGYSAGDYSAYTILHATIASITGDNDYIQVKITSTDKDAKFINLTATENVIDLTELTGDVDFSKITEITLWGTGSSDGSAVISEFYMEKPDAPFVSTVSNGFGDEITDFNYISSGENSFVIGSSDGTKVLYFDEGNNSKSALVTSISNSAYFTCYLEKITDSGLSGENIYRIRIKNLIGTDYSGVSSGQYLNTPNTGWSISFSGISDKTQSNNLSYGQDANNNGLWYVNYDQTNGFSIQNVGKANDGNGWPSWLKVDGLDGSKQYLKLYKSINFSSTTVHPANDQLFLLSDATGYNPDTKYISTGGWTFTDPIDLSSWKYLVITMSQSASNTSAKVHLADNDGHSCTDEDSNHDDFHSMVLDKHNNRNALCIDLNYLATTKSLDLHNIKSLTFDGYFGGDAKIYISQVYLTDYLSTNMLGSGYSPQHNGNKEITCTELQKYGTICLPYKASVAGAMIYGIAEKKGNGITLERVDGLLEAGRPYFYCTNDGIGSYDGDTPQLGNVHFFRADFDEYDSEQPISNNGLIGTFSDMTAPAGSNYWILSGNKLYDTEGCTGDDAVTVGANKAYINTSLIVNAPSASRSAFIMFDEATGIKAVQGNDVTATQEGIFNLNGQRMNQLKKGLNIVNGKKVMVK